MNMQAIVREAQKMKKELEKAQKELENTEYEGSSSAVKIVLNGNKDLKSIFIDKDFEVEGDFEMLEDMILVAFKDASKKVDDDKNKKLSKYGSGLSGLM